MLSQLKSTLKRWQEVLIVAPVVASFTIAGNLTGICQILEWTALDRMISLRPTEPTDDRVVVVTYDESDIDQIGQWPFSDAVLAELISKISQFKPRAIGMDIYRNLAVEPGQEQLVRVLQTTPNLIGIEKALGNSVPAAPTLIEQGQVALADLILDSDGKVRRALISIQDREQIKLSLGARLALMYLDAEGITLESVTPAFPNLRGDRQQLKLAQARFSPFRSNDGGYVHADAGGYQILLNYRGTEANFKTVSAIDVLNDRIPPGLMSDRVVLIGARAESLNDFFYTPYSNSIFGSPQRTPGVIIHANIVSQIISTAIDGRPLIQVLPEWLEWLWILSWSFIGAIVSNWLLKGHQFNSSLLSSIKWSFLSIVIAGGSLVSMTYVAYLTGWWLPVFTPILALSGSTLAMGTCHNRYLHQLAFIDGLTQIPNRRYFDQSLDREWLKSKHKNIPLSLIVCDVDHFKIYNDTYGHQGGDECLQKVAQGMQSAVRKNDIVARYGGEEFVVILPETSGAIALQVAERIGESISTLQITHANSPVKPHVTLSLGVACSIPNRPSSTEELIEIADRALYQAKGNGRDRAFLANVSTSEHQGNI